MLNADLRNELERRLAVIARDVEADADTRDLLPADMLWLLGLLAGACLAVPLMQAL